MLTVELEHHPATRETLIFVKSSKGGNDRMLYGALNSVEAAEEIGEALAVSLGATFAGASVHTAHQCAANLLIRE